MSSFFTSLYVHRSLQHRGRCMLYVCTSKFERTYDTPLLSATPLSASALRQGSALASTTPQFTLPHDGRHCNPPKRCPGSHSCGLRCCRRLEAAWFLFRGEFCSVSFVFLFCKQMKHQTMRYPDLSLPCTSIHQFSFLATFTNGCFDRPLKLPGLGNMR